MSARLALLWRGLIAHFAFWELSAIAWLLLLPYIMTAHGHLDWTGHALGRDFVNVWTAGHLVVEHRIADIFQPDRFLAQEHRLFDPRLPFHFWSYPPIALFLAAPLGLTRYIPGLILWSVAGIAVLVPAAALYLRAPIDRALLVCAPAAAVNVALGQNGAFTAALLISGLALWRRKPLWAGGLLGLLVFKPQIAVLLPVAVIAERRWRLMAAAIAGGGALLMLSVPVFGIDAWRGFFGPTLKMQSTMLSQGSGPFQWMMPSAFMAARLLHAPAAWAMAVQLPFTLVGIGLTWRAFRSEADLQLKSAVLMMATFVASPQAFNYDLIPAAAAALVLWRRDEGAVSRGLAVAVWALPAVMIALQAVHIVVAPIVLTGAAWQLYTLCAAPMPSRAASRSAASELGSNT